MNIIIIQSGFSKVTYSVTHSHVQLQKNSSNRYYGIKEKLKFKLSEIENSELMTSIPFSYKNSVGECQKIETKEKNLDIQMGQNKLFSCFLELNKLEFVEFCNSQEEFIILSKIIKNYINWI